MPNLTKSFAVLALSLFVSSTVVAAVPAPLDKAPDNKPAEQKPSEVLPVKTGITPHRAIYDMSLSSVKNGSNIVGVSGRMMFEWRDVCDGWAVQQHLRLHFSYAEGDESNVASTEVTWESKDGKRYNFNIRRVTDGKESEVFRGKARLEEDGSGTVTYTIPEGKTLKLPAGTVFPSTHTAMILQKAAAGEKLFSRNIFDGSDEEGSNDVSTFMHAPVAQWQETDLSAKLKTNPMLAEPAWPVRMAFFNLNTETGEPDYEMNLNLLGNGVAERMQIDYGDFSVSGTLSDIEAIPPSVCQ